MSPSLFFALISALAQVDTAGGPPTAASPPAPPGGETQAPGVTVTAHRIQHVGPVTVTAAQACPEPDPAHNPANHDPAVVDSYPRDGAAVRAGLVQVRVSFDAPMSCYAEVSSEGGDSDPCEAQGTWVLPGRRSFLMQCRLQPGATYVLKFQKADGRGFVGMSGRDAEPFVLHFTAQAGPPVTSWQDAQRDDPGPPGARTADAYVTCTDATPAVPNSDCRRQRLGAPAPATPP